MCRPVQNNAFVFSSLQQTAFFRLPVGAVRQQRPKGQLGHNPADPADNYGKVCWLACSLLAPDARDHIPFPAFSHLVLFRVCRPDQV